jgi:hypothetical protein
MLWIAASAFAGCGGRDDGSSRIATAVTPSPLRETDDRRPSAQSGPGRAASPGDHACELPARRQESDSPCAQAIHRPEERRQILSRADVVSFERLERSLGGHHGLAVSTLGVDQPVERVGGVLSGAAWSTSKVPIAMAVITKGATRAQRADIARSLTVSDNAAAARLWSSLGGGETAASAVDRQLRRAGDMRTHVEDRPLRGDSYTPFGQTNWTLRHQARFTAALVCSRAGREVLEVMDEVTRAQRWGLGSAGVPAQFKGGWGPGSRPGVPGAYFDRQMGVITIEGKPLAVAVAARPADGSHETGTRNLTAIARWLVVHANVGDLPPNADC